ncbi:MAG: AmmeMemoRadiSam system protein B [Chlorobiaceae bacterium]|nr:AmmeMemoRadiSam system protein B [Chlorobiaceae bacterium]
MQQPIVRHPAVAEEFYPSDAEELGALLSELFPNEPIPEGGRNVKAVIAPHAAYRYGGVVSAKAYGPLAGRSVRTAIMMGNAHAYLFDNVAIDPHESWESPLGRVPVDREMGLRLTSAGSGRIHELDIAHHCDHVLEVQLPFLQHQLKPGFSILPMLFGQSRPDIYRTIADDLISVMGDDDLIVASSDLSHYPSYRDASKIDRTTLEFMSKMDIDALERHQEEVRQRTIQGAMSAFCSPDAVKTLLEIARRLGWKAGEPAYRNSGDAVHDDRLAVVGYGALAFYEP